MMAFVIALINTTVNIASICIVDFSVADGKHNDHSLFSMPNCEECGGRLLRLDSSVDMKLGDLGGT